MNLLKIDEWAMIHFWFFFLSFDNRFHQNLERYFVKAVHKAILLVDHEFVREEVWGVGGGFSPATPVLYSVIY